MGDIFIAKVGADWLISFVMAREKGSLHGRNGGGTEYRESSSIPEGARPRIRVKAQRLSLMSGVPRAT